MSDDLLTNEEENGGEKLKNSIRNYLEERQMENTKSEKPFPKKRVFDIIGLLFLLLLLLTESICCLVTLSGSIELIEVMNVFFVCCISFEVTFVFMFILYVGIFHFL